MRRLTRQTAVTILVFVMTIPVWTQSKRIYIANDDHTDLMWAGDETMYRDAWLNMLDFYLDQADRTAANISDHQGRFNADGSYWAWIYEKNRTSQQFQRLMDRVKDGHITIPLQTLVMLYGGMPAEAVIRSMYYAGRLERRYDTRFRLACAMEDQTLPYGLPSLWAGSGARYSWKGVCRCWTNVPGLSDRGREIYNAVGPDGRGVLMKWHSWDDGADDSNWWPSGGYAECRRGNSPAWAVGFASNNQPFLNRYPLPNVVGMFGWGWDDLQTATDLFVKTAQDSSSAQRRVIVSNELDFFADYESNAPAGVTPAYSASFGNDWDCNVATMAEVTASVKRAVEDLRSAEALTLLVSLAQPSFMAGRAAKADSAFNAMGLYFEHNWNNDGAYTSHRPAFNRAKAAQISGYVSSLKADAASALAGVIRRTGTATRFFVFNPLSWARTDVANVDVTPPQPFRVIEQGSGREVRSQAYTKGGRKFIRILAENVPSFGYRIYEIQNGAGHNADSAATFSNGNATIENAHYRITVDGRGAISSLVDKTDGDRQWVQIIGSRAMNDLGSGTGSPTPENVGPVSASVLVNAGGTPAHRTRVTLYSGVPRTEIENEITENFVGYPPLFYSYGVNISGATVRHEEVGAIATARLHSQGGTYSPTSAVYQYLTMNHFVDLSNASRGITLSNWDSQFFQLGNSSASVLDVTTPQINAIVGGRLAPSTQAFGGQDGDSYFLNRYALQTHGSYDQAAAMRMALEHQNPFVTSLLSGGGSFYPDTAFSLLSVSDSSVILWAAKPSEEGIADPTHGGVILRFWNLSEEPRSLRVAFNATPSNARKTTHIETDIDDAILDGVVLTDAFPSQRMQTYRVSLGWPLLNVSHGSSNLSPFRIWLEQNYPNPFNPTTSIGFRVSGLGSRGVKLAVYDVLGREVAVLANGTKAPGSYTVSLDGTRLPSGMYIYRLTAGGHVESRKMQLIK
jgi:alpha-mannosidase